MKILVTGGSSGLGLKITELLAKKNYNVYFTYNNSLKNALKIENKYNNVLGIKCNFKDMNSIDELIKYIEDIEFEGLVHNAHTKFKRKQFLKLDTEDFKDGFNHNIYPILKI